MLNIKHKTSGFTLIELAIVLLIVGVLAGSFLSTLGSRIDATRRGDAIKEMEVIKQALYGYAMTQGTNNLRLPCPDCRNAGCATIIAAAGSLANDGVEDRTDAGVCATGDNGVGNLPWTTLGLGSGDPWYNRYSYWVSRDVARNNTPPLGFELDTAMATATIRTRIPDSVPPPPTQTPDISTSAIAVIISRGKNGYGTSSVQNKINAVPPAANPDELENNDGDAVYISRPPTDIGASTPGGEFDDLLVWISEYELKAKMVEAGVLPP